MIFVSRLLIAAVLGALLSCAVHAQECRVLRTPAAVGETIRLENGLLSATVPLHLNGVISSLQWVANNTEFITASTTEVEEFFPGLGLYYIRPERNYGGFEDWLWGTRLHMAHRSYRLLAEENGPARAEVTIGWEDSQRVIIRSMAMTARSALMEIRVTVTNKTSETASIAYWGHLSVRPGGEVTLNDTNRMLLCIPARSVPAPVQKLSIVLNSDQLLLKGITTGNIFAPPAQNWWACVNAAKKLAFVMFFDRAAMDPDGLLYCNVSDATAQQQEPIVTMELIYPKLDYGGGKSRTFLMQFGVANGVNRVHAAGAWGVLDCSGAIFRYAPFAGNSPSRLKLTSKTRSVTLTFAPGNPGLAREPESVEGDLAITDIRASGASGAWLDNDGKETASFIILPEGCIS